MISASSEPFKIFAFLVVMKIHSNVLLFFLSFIYHMIRLKLTSVWL